MSERLLVCIAFHYAEHRIDYLRMVVSELEKYEFDKRIMVDTNSNETHNIDFLKKENIDVCVHESLSHPYLLTSVHRIHIANNVDNYDWFMYVEDDMVIPYENFLRYKEKFKELWPTYVPGFVRVEQYTGPESDKFSPDIMIEINNNMVVEVNGKRYVNMPYHYNYHAFWILPKSALIECVEKIGIDSFLEVTENRERSASFVIWVMNVPCLLSIDDSGKLDKSCLSYHTPNNYPHSARRLEDIWRVT